ncbi:MAG: HEAT repeat domain-containing protein [Solirubrobacterales bacterium]|nr:HEAT repeat domain-containing protein [Solirubrobacterales bacterium]
MLPSSAPLDDKIWALAELSRMNAVESCGAVLMCTTDSDPVLRRCAVRALVEMDCKQAPSALTNALKDSSSAVRAAAARYSRHSADTAVLAALSFAASSDSDQTVRTEAVQALGYSQDRSAYSVVVGSLGDHVRLVRLAAAKTALRMDSAAARPVVRAAATNASLVEKLLLRWFLVRDKIRLTHLWNGVKTFGRALFDYFLP